MRAKKYQMHGMVHTIEYATWCRMKYRCATLKGATYRKYKARGIEVCERWKDSFSNFFEDMGVRPSKSHSLERIDNSKGYSPDNCRWATAREQGQNTRRNKYLTFQGRKLCVTEWARLLNVSTGCIRNRLAKGLSVKEALSPINCKITE